MAWTSAPLSTPLIGTSVHRFQSNDASIDIGDDVRAHQLIPHITTHNRLDLIHRLRHLFLELKPYHVIWLAALSILESIVVSQVGKVAGSFYQILVDKQPGALINALAHAAILYATCALIGAAGVWLSGWLSLKWRNHLASSLHAKLCSNASFIHLFQRRHQSPPTDIHIDNPDQRATTEIALLCDSLGNAVRLIAGVPFRIIFYAYLAHIYIGWTGVCAACIFFWGGTLFQKVVALPLSHSVLLQEKKEGDLRYSHARLREYSNEIAVYKGEGAEQAHLDGLLSAVLQNQSRLVALKAGMAGTTKLTDYSGALLNYVLVAVAVFSGTIALSSVDEPGSDSDSGSGGQVAEYISNASFFTLSLIYSLTEVLDMAENASTLAALIVRTSEMFEFISAPRTPVDGVSEVGAAAGVLDAHNGLEMKPSILARCVLPPTQCSFPSIPSMEVSIHDLGVDLRKEIQNIFPAAPVTSDASPSLSTSSSTTTSNNNNSTILCCMAIQFAGNGSIDLSPDRSSATLDIASTEMDRLLDNFLQWETSIREILSSRGYWCDSVDPRTGMALHGVKGNRWSEVAAAKALLGYETRESGICPLLIHPEFGTSAYPVSVFTNAPEEVFISILSSISRSLLLSQQPIKNNGILARFDDISISTPDHSRTLITSLSFILHKHKHILITGPNGAGKSTLLRALCNIYPRNSGSITWYLKENPLIGPCCSDAASSPAAGTPNYDEIFPSSVMFLPQRPLLAPGNTSTLSQQLAYPSTLRHEDVLLRSVLSKTGLEYLLERVGGSFDEKYRWDSSSLSPGEQQRLAFARILLHKPRVVFLDESTCAMSENASSDLYALLHQAGITCISVGQDCEMMKRLHSVHIHLRGGRDEYIYSRGSRIKGTWSMNDLISISS